MSDAGLAVGDRALENPGDVHPDWCAGYGANGGLLVIGASAVGHLHLREMVPRDDAFAARSAGPWLAVAVSDGVGSKPLSRYGSTFCVQALCEELLHDLVIQPFPFANCPVTDVSSVGSKEVTRGWRDTLSPLTGRLLEDSTIAQLHGSAQHAGTLTWNRHLSPRVPRHSEPAAAEGATVDAKARLARAFTETRSRLERFASDRNLDLHAVSCTLLGLLVNTETGHGAWGQVGDGLITLLHSETGTRAMECSPAPDGVGSTWVFTQNDWQNHFTTEVLTKEEAVGTSSIMLMTDGVSEDYSHPPPEGLLEKWSHDMDTRMRETSPAFASLRLLHWLASYEQPGSFDDRTLVTVLTVNRPTPDDSLSEAGSTTSRSSRHIPKLKPAVVQAPEEQYHTAEEEG